MREIRMLRAMWRELETGLMATAPTLDPTSGHAGVSSRQMRLYHLLWQVQLAQEFVAGFVTECVETGANAFLESSLLNARRSQPSGA